MKTLKMPTIIALAAFAICAFAFKGPDLLSFDKMEFDFGHIAQGIPQKTIFILTNKSDHPLLLTKVKGSCGCTATNYSKTAVAPGEHTEIEATYNAKSVGAFQKTITVTTNLSETPTILRIKGTVDAGAQ